MSEAAENVAARPAEGSIIDTRYWHALEDGRVQCDVCPRACKLRDGQRGLCFVRGAQTGLIKLFSYGRSSGFCVDPIEKKPLDHFLPGTSVLSFGTAGCNLACKFCQNWDMSKSREMDTLADGASPEDLAHAAERLGCASIAFTYNDPVVFMEYAIDAAQAGRARGISSVAVTAGYMCAEPRAEFYRHMDAANVDLKAFTERFYYKICGGALAPVLETLEYLKRETNVWFEITTLLIPGENDSDGELDRMTLWIVEKLGPDVPLHFTAFHPDWKMLDNPRTPPATLTRARRIALANGLHYVYTGNVHDAEGGSTYCPHCRTRVIERDWYELGAWQLTETGTCKNCGTQIPGVFAGPPVPGAHAASECGSRRTRRRRADSLLQRAIKPPNCCAPHCANVSAFSVGGSILIGSFCRRSQGQCDDGRSLRCLEATMAFHVRRIDYFSTSVRDEPGEAYKLLAALANLGVNLLAFTAVPTGPLHTQLTIFPEDSAKLANEAKKDRLVLDGPHPALLVRGDDELGALAELHMKLMKANVNVYAATGVADGGGSFGYVIYVRPEQYNLAVAALGL